MTTNDLKRWLPLAVCVNACVAIRAATNNLGVWFAIGVAVGLTITAAF
jgi:hypothetical protein